jgi:glutamate/tyrosine decarboxylase-like PLP-dependent enzyme
MKTLQQLETISKQLEQQAGHRSLISQKANEYAEQFLNGLDHMPGYTKGSLDQLESLQFDEEGTPIDALLDILKTEVDAVGINAASGRHMGYIPGGGLWTSSVADMLAALTNRYAGIAFSGPGSVKIEDQVIEWLLSIVNYPQQQGYGNLTSGGSTANLIAVKAARDYHQINSSNVKDAVIYFTQQTHHCLHKALHTTGLHEAILRYVPMNEKFQMSGDALKEQMMSDKWDGLKPFLVVATAGTTDTGAIDDLNAIADICKEFKAWFHVDAAYGGFFMLVDEMNKKLSGIERSDSVVLDPHKTLFIPYGSGAVLLRDKNILFSSNSYKASYMKDSFHVDAINPADTGIELSRHNRALRIWLPLHLHGIKPFRAALKEKLLLTQYFFEKIKALGFETACEPELSIVVFRWPADEDNSINQQLIERIHEDGRVFLSSTIINNKLWIRCALVSHRSHLREVDIALQMIEENMQALKLKPSFLQQHR